MRRPARLCPVSYTHLDVYKRQIMDRIVHNATWMELGDINMRERLSSRKDG